ncbi:MAG: serine/threonine-protein kinase [Acetivibrionales bacterium]
MKENELFQNKYKIIRTLGEGGMSKVYLAENIKLGSRWAIKTVNKNNNSQFEFLVEPNILKRLNHPSLPRVFDIFEDEESFYIIEDYIEGVPLDKKLKECGRFTEEKVIKWARQICDVLIYLHSFKPNPIIYRDMKPSNIILSEDENIKLIDFGIAREYKKGAESDTVYIGTRGYAAPEQYGIGQSNQATDIYSLGVTLYELLTGKGPNRPHCSNIRVTETPADGISIGMMSILTKCTMENPEDRYHTVDEVLNDINRINGNGIQDKNINIESVDGLNNNKSGNRVTSFKKLILTVWDNAEFGCEMAYAAARLTNFDIILADLNLLSPKADLWLNVRKMPDRIVNEGVFKETGINIVMDSIEKGCLTSGILAEASVKRRELRNLYILTGNYKIENYEYYKNESLIELIEKCYSNFDITILLVNRFIYDSYTVISLIKSDYNLVPLQANIGELREFNSYIRFLEESQQIPMEKTKFVAFEYDNTVNLAENAIKEITEGNYIGNIPLSKRRIKYRSLNIPYSRRMEKDVLSAYIKILSKFNIVPRPLLVERIKMFLGLKAASYINQGGIPGFGMKRSD